MPLSGQSKETYLVTRQGLRAGCVSQGELELYVSLGLEVKPRRSPPSFGEQRTSPIPTPHLAKDSRGN